MDNHILTHENIVYNDGEIELKVSIESETVWLNRQQLATLFDRDVKTIGKHVNNVFKDGELMKEVVVAKFATTTQHGAIKDKIQTKLVEYYNLDMIISVGYRVKSQRGVAFRQWATKVLKQYIVHGYAINSAKITVDRFLNLEKDVIELKNTMQDVNKVISGNQIELQQGVFYDGQIYDAYTFVNDVLKSAQKDVILVDNYIDDTVLTLFSKFSKLNFIIVCKSLSKQLKLDIAKYNSQYKNLTIQTSNRFHDRFLVCDHKEAYHIGASLKDLGKKVFGFNKIDATLLLEILDISRSDEK